MVSSFELDSLKAEKAAALQRYNRKRIFSNCFRVVAALVFLVCFFTWLPVIKATVFYFLSFLNNQFFVFVLLNVIVLLVHHLSTTNDTAPTNSNNKSEFNCFKSDLYEQYVTVTAHRRKSTNQDTEKQLVVSLAAELENLDNKQLACSTNVEPAPVEENPVRDLYLVGDSTPKEKRNLGRSRSERSGRDMMTMKKNDSREMRRSETVGRKLMDEMNNEEFRLTIESFIASTKRIFMYENIAVLTEEKPLITK